MRIPKAFASRESKVFQNWPKVLGTARELIVANSGHYRRVPNPSRRSAPIFTPPSKRQLAHRRFAGAQRSRLRKVAFLTSCLF